MRGNQGTSCLLGIPTPGPFCCLKLDCSVFVLVTGGDFRVSCDVRVLVYFNPFLYRLQTPSLLAPDATRAMKIA